MDRYCFRLFANVWSCEPIFYTKQLQQLSVKNVLAFTYTERSKLADLHRVIRSVKKTQIILGHE